MEGYNEFYGQRPQFQENPGIPVKNQKASEGWNQAQEGALIPNEMIKMISIRITNVNSTYTP